MNELWKSRMTRRIVVVLLILATALALYAFSAEAAPLPPRRTMKPWPPAPARQSQPAELLSEVWTMKIKIITAPLLNPAYGLTVGTVHTARTNWMAGKEPKWFVDIPNKCDGTTFPVGIRSDEAQEEVAE